MGRNQALILIQSLVAAYVRPAASRAESLRKRRSTVQRVFAAMTGVSPSEEELEKIDKEFAELLTKDHEHVWGPAEEYNLLNSRNGVRRGDRCRLCGVWRDDIAAEGNKK